MQEQYPPLTLREQLDLIYEARASFGEEAAKELAQAFDLTWCLAFTGVASE